MGKTVYPDLQFLLIFIRPSSDGTYYGMVMSVRPSVRVSVRPSIPPSVRHSFPHFSPTRFDILIWNFLYHFIFMHVRSSSNAINFRHFLQELCSFFTSNSYKYAVFCTFLLHALTYWVQILYFYDFVLMYHRASLSVVILLQFLLELCLFVNLEYSKYTVFHTFLFMLWHIELKFCIWLCFTILQIKFECRQFASIFVGVMPLLELRILEIHSFPHLSLTPFNKLSWKFAYYFVFFSVLQIKFECRQFASILELCLFSNLEYCKYSFLHFSLTRFDILSWNFCTWLCFTVLGSTSSVVNGYQFL